MAVAHESMVTAEFRRPIRGIGLMRLLRASAANAAFVDALGSGLVMSMTVLYFSLLTDLPLADIGFAVAAAGIAALPLGVLGGWLCDRFSSRAAMVLNNGLAALGYILYLAADNFALVFTAFLLVAIGDRIYWAAWTSYVHDLSAGRPYEQLFARLESAKMAAMGGGAAISAIVLAVGAATGARWLVVANIVLTVVAAAIYARIPMPAAEPSDPSEPRTSSHTAVRVVRQRGFLSITVGQFFLAPIMVLPQAALSVFFVSEWGMNPAVASVLFGVSAAGVAAFQTRVSDLVKFVSRASLVAIACAVLVAVILPLAVLPQLSGAAAWAFVIVISLAMAAADMLYMPATNALMAEIPERPVRGVSISVFQTSMAVGMALYPAALGLLERQPDTLWFLTSASIALGAICYGIASRRAPESVRVSEVRLASS
jgi:MFS family permease